MNTEISERIILVMDNKRLKLDEVSERTSVSVNTLVRYRQGTTEPKEYFIKNFCREYGVNKEWLLSGKGEMFASGHEVVIGKNHLTAEENGAGELLFIDILELKASCGPGEMIPEDVNVVTRFPVLKRILEPFQYGMKGCLARGDSMTPTIYHGDYVFYLPGDVSGDGIYVIKRGCELICKRVSFRMDGSVIIKSDNERYPPEEFRDYAGLFQIVGKVHGWVHLHRY